MANWYPFKDALSLGDFVSADVALTQNDWTRCGAGKQVSIGTRLMLGFGDITSQSGAMGRIYAKLCSAANTLIAGGKVRFVLLTPDGRPIKVLFQDSVVGLSTSVSDPTQQRAFPILGDRANYGYRIVMEIFTTSAGLSLDVSESALNMDVTAYSRTN